MIVSQRTVGASDTQPWWIWEVSGLMTVAVGVLVLAEPGKSLQALAVIAGLYCLVDAILAFASLPGGDPEHRAYGALHGIVSLVIGLLLVRHPLQSLTAIALLIGIWLLAVGCVRLVGAIGSSTHRGLRVLVALVQAVAGIVIISQPHIGYNTLAIVAGVALALQGIAMIALGWLGRGAERDESSGTLRAGPVAP
jgi:uncharacterized membrane protein HdeD (DUF308 family)